MDLIRRLLAHFRLTPAPPVSEEDAAWIEQKIVWLFGQFGGKAIAARPVHLIGESEVLAPSGPARKEGMVRLLHDICRLMDVDRRVVELRFKDDVSADRPDWGRKIWVEEENPLHQSAKRRAGTYSEAVWKAGRRCAITLDIDRRATRGALAAVMAHELSHYKLLGEDRMAANDERLTDLVPLAFGLGVVMANAALTADKRGLTERGYLSPHLYGYALAVLAYLSGQDTPTWVEHLQKDARWVFRDGMRYLHRTGKLTVARMYYLSPQ